ncbi:MAG TPA: hypothetical protein VF219_14940 [Vicinamibacterales bacterium]
MNMRLLLGSLGLLLATSVRASAAPTTTPTFNKDVLPILQEKCQSCHRPGQLAPMSLLTYAESRPWARAIKTAVTRRKMPPWFADPQYGHFRNEAALAPMQIDTIVAWVDGGSVEGEANDAPPVVKWPSDGWEIQPDVIVDGVPYTVPAHTRNEVVEWMYVVVPNPFTKDTWVTSMEIRPSEPSVTHHICVYLRAHTPDAPYNKLIWEDKARDGDGSVAAEAAGVGSAGRSVANGPIQGCFVPGHALEDYGSYNAAKLIPAGSDIVFSLHYTPNGKELTDLPRVGFTLAKGEPQREYRTLITSAPQDATSFAIPPNDPNWKSPNMEGTFLQDAELVWMSPHMHLRGKDMTYTLIYPDGRPETVLSVPRYDFNWQLGYALAEPIKVPKGTRMVVTAHFDNSSANRFNPNPTRTVYYGEMSWEEMMTPFFSVVVDRGATRNPIFKTEVKAKD